MALKLANVTHRLFDVVADPVEGSRYRLLPLAELMLTFGRLHFKPPTPSLGLTDTNVLPSGPEADGNAHHVGRVKGRRLRNHRRHHLRVEDAGLELYEQTVDGHAAVGP